MPSAAVAKKKCPRCGSIFDLDAAFCPSDGTKLESPGSLDPDVDPYIGTVIHGDIEIRSVAGSGAMGRVYRAHQRGIDRDVAVKILHRELSGNLPLVQRFLREGKIASKLQHPHVVEVYLAGQLPDGALYIAMEYLDGMSLAAALAAAGGVLPLERAIPIALQICDAVGEGHARGIVHRDLKPENVMLVRRADTSDWVKVLDFGIAKVSIGEQSMETAAGLIFGTARYISPEGAQGAAVGPPGDVYSIAVMLYQLLSGKTPFDAAQPVGLLIKHIHEAPPPLLSWPQAAEVPTQIARVVMDNLAKDPTRRAASARAFGNALASAAKAANVSFSDVGVVARMSMLDLAVRPAIEPTLDDAAAVPAPVVALPVPAPVDRSPLPSADAEANTELGSHPPRPILAPKASVETPPSKRETRRPLALILLAFLLGVALAALVMQQLAHRRDAERDAYVEKTRRALAAGRYVSPPGDNVRDLVANGHKRWPNDVAFTRVTSEAAHELVTRAMAARSGGDLGQARDLVAIALEFDSADHAARILLEQYEDELALEAAGAPRVLLDVPTGRARLGSRFELAAKLTVGGGPPKNVLSPRFTVSGPGLPEGGSTFPATSAAAAGRFTTAVVAPREGSYEIIFEATADGVPLRAERSLDVTR